MLRLGRFHFLFGGLLLYLVGAMIAIKAGSSSDIMRLIFGYMVLAPGHLSVSYSNDLFDMEADRFNEPSPFSGGSGVLERRPDLRRAALWTAVSLMVVSVSLSVVFSLVYGMGPAFVVFVIFGNLLGWFYTAPPLKLAYRGFGEISTAMAVGILVPFMGFYSMWGGIHIPIIVLGLPFLLYGVAFIASVQLPDREADMKGGKRTMVVLWGMRFSSALVFTSAVLASVSFLSFYLLGMGPEGLPMGLFWLLSLIPVAAALPMVLRAPNDKESASKRVFISLSCQFLFLGSLIAVMLFL